jgi:hypothetical protein
MWSGMLQISLIHTRVAMDHMTSVPVLSCFSHLCGGQTLSRTMDIAGYILSKCQSHLLHRLICQHGKFRLALEPGWHPEEQSGALSTSDTTREGADRTRGWIWQAATWILSEYIKSKNVATACYLPLISMALFHRKMGFFMIGVFLVGIIWSCLCSCTWIWGWFPLTYF